jgi:hypothetical protein
MQALLEEVWAVLPGLSADDRGAAASLVARMVAAVGDPAVSVQWLLRFLQPPPGVALPLAARLVLAGRVAHEAPLPADDDCWAVAVHALLEGAVAADAAVRDAVIDALIPGLLAWDRAHGAARRRVLLAVCVSSLALHLSD